MLALCPEAASPVTGEPHEQDRERRRARPAIPRRAHPSLMDRRGGVRRAAGRRLRPREDGADLGQLQPGARRLRDLARSEEHTSELQSLMRISYAVFCLKKKNNYKTTHRKHILKTNTT